MAVDPDRLMDLVNRFVPAPLWMLVLRGRRPVTRTAFGPAVWTS
jgi:hypothetical protein